MPKANDRIGPYQLIRKLGEGGFGEVWLARDFSGSTLREVAVKMPLRSEIDLDALLQEATVWARATGHPNVLEFLAARVFDGQVALVSEYAPDGSLTDWLRQHGGRAPSVEAAVEMTRGILAGLEHLHGRSIIHRDIKPENVLLLGATPRLADFGISRVFKSISESIVTAGTPLYMAPEAFNRKRNQQTDIWSAGVMFYQLLSGRLPFDGNDMAELYGAILNEEPDPLPADIPERLRQVVAKAMTKEPEQRYQTVAEMRAALTPQPQPVKAPPAPPPPRRTLTVDEPPPKREPTVAEPKLPPKSARSSRLRVSVKWGAGLAAVVIALAAYQITRTPSSTSPGLLNPSGNTQTLPNWGEVFTENLNGVKLEMVRVPRGSFLMGSPESEVGRRKNEGPQHQVTVPSFYIGKYEVTQAQWQAVMGSNPSRFKGDDLPVESVPWNDAKAFCSRLNRMTGKTYRLPSEAEWEYACRAGTTGAFAGELDAMAWYADNSGAKRINARTLWNQLNDLGKYLYRLDENGNKTHPVGRKQGNAFKLHDMHGNVWEWCEDVYHDSYGERHGNPPNDGSAWTTGGEQQYRVGRGGSFFDFGYCRSATRFKVEFRSRDSSFGVRIALSEKTP